MSSNRLKIISYKRMEVAEGLIVPVSRHFYYSSFGVRSRYAAIDNMGVYLSTDAPGTGFFVRACDSHSYLRYVKELRKSQKQNLWTLIAGKEPNFKKLIAQVEKSISATTDEEKRRMLDSYLNCLLIAKDAELMERIVRGVKDKMGEKHRKYMVSVISHYKSRIATLEHDLHAAQINEKERVGEDVFSQWEKVVEAFHLLVNARRLWSVESGGSNSPNSYHQVFADMGVFQFLYSPVDTPLLRDHQGYSYYFYPQGIIRVRSVLDFDLFTYDKLTFQFGVVDINTLSGHLEFGHKKKKNKKKSHTDALSTLYGMNRAQVVGELMVPELGLHIFCNHTGPVDDFVKAINTYISATNQR